MSICECVCLYLLGSQHHRHHTLRLGGLGALINQDGAELHLGQTRVSSTDAGAADHISILYNKQREIIYKTETEEGARAQGETQGDLIL